MFTSAGPQTSLDPGLTQSCLKLKRKLDGGCNAVATAH